MFDKLVQINSRPKAFEFYTAEELWTDKYRSRQMLQYHLNESIDVSSRNHNFINKSAEWIYKHFKLDENKKIADFGCGPGLYTKRLTEKKLNVTGIDFSLNSIEYAKNIAEQNGLNINYINENYLDFESNEKFDLIIMIMCDFCALSPDQRQTLLKKFYSCLKDDGSILLDVYSLNAFKEREEMSRYEKNQLSQFWSENDYYAFVNTFKYEKEKVCLDKFTIIEESKSYTVFNWLQYFSVENLQKEFYQAQFSITELLANVAGEEYSENSNEFAVIGKKRL